MTDDSFPSLTRPVHSRARSQKIMADSVRGYCLLLCLRPKPGRTISCAAWEWFPIFSNEKGQDPRQLTTPARSSHGQLGKQGTTDGLSPLFRPYCFVPHKKFRWWRHMPDSNAGPHGVRIGAPTLLVATLGPKGWNSADKERWRSATTLFSAVVYPFSAIRTLNSSKDCAVESSVVMQTKISQDKFSSWSLVF